MKMLNVLRLRIQNLESANVQKENATLRERQRIEELEALLSIRSGEEQMARKETAELASVLSNMRRLLSMRILSDPYIYIKSLTCTIESYELHLTPIQIYEGLRTNSYKKRMC